MRQIVFFAPVKDAEKIKETMFAQKAGNYGNYDKASWQCEGTGQYRPLAGAKPFKGVIGELHREPELRIEMFCEDEYIDAVISAMLKAHPYEQPAFYVINIESGF